MEGEASEENRKAKDLASLGDCVSRLENVVHALYEGLDNLCGGQTSQAPTHWRHVPGPAVLSALPGTTNKSLMQLREEFNNVTTLIRNTVEQYKFNVTMMPSQNATRYHQHLSRASSRVKSRLHLSSVVHETQRAMEKHLRDSGRPLSVSTHMSSSSDLPLPRMLPEQLKRIADAVGMTFDNAAGSLVLMTQQHFLLDIELNRLECKVTHFDESLQSDVNQAVLSFLKQRRFDELKAKLQWIAKLEPSDEQNGAGALPDVVPDQFKRAGVAMHQLQQLSCPSSRPVRMLEGPALKLELGLERQPVSALVLVALTLGQEDKPNWILQLQGASFPHEPKVIYVSSRTAAALHACSAGEYTRAKLMSERPVEDTDLLQGGSLHTLLLTGTQQSSTSNSSAERLSGKKRSRGGNQNPRSKMNNEKYFGEDGAISAFTTRYRCQPSLDPPSALLQRGYAVSLFPILECNLELVAGLLQQEILFAYLYQSCFRSETLSPPNSNAPITADVRVTCHPPSWLEFAILEPKAGAISPIRISIAEGCGIRFETHVSVRWTTSKQHPCTEKYMLHVLRMSQSISVLLHYVISASETLQ